MRIENNILIAECTAYDFKGELERKKIRSWLKSVSAFANTDGGTLFFGVDNDARVVGVANPQKDLEFISEIGSEVAINIYDDRIETTSPGGITDGFDPVRLEPEKITSKRRNPVIAEVFSQLRYMEKRGSGLRKIQDATALLPSYKPDRKPIFESSREFFYTTIPNVNYGMTDADFEKLSRKIHPENEEFTQRIHPEKENFTQRIHPEEEAKTSRKKIGKTAQAIIDAIVADPKITRKGLAELIGKSEDTVKYHLASLQERQIIVHVGPDYGGYWKVLFKK